MSDYPNFTAATTSANNALCTITFAPLTNAAFRYELLNVICGYNNTPAAGCLLTVQRHPATGPNITIIQLPIIDGGAAPIDCRGFTSKNNESLIITLSASGVSGVTGYLSAAAKGF